MVALCSEGQSGVNSVAVLSPLFAWRVGESERSESDEGRLAEDAAFYPDRERESKLNTS